MKTNGFKKMLPRARFRILNFTNPRTGSESWRVTGSRKNGERIRENFANAKEAQFRQTELEVEFLSRESESSLRSTRLTESQVSIAEAAFRLVDEDAQLFTAVRYWHAHGRGHAPGESVRLDDAFDQFKAALEADASLRSLTKTVTRLRVSAFVNATANIDVADVTPETVERFLDGMKGAARNRINYKHGISKFFGWCMERPRRWLAVNPCAAVKVKIGEAPPPVVLTVADCERLVRVAEEFKDGRLVPYLSLTMFAGLRPFEARRMKWEQVNFEDGEIRIEGAQSKTGRPRTFKMDATTATWLRACKGRDFFPENAVNDLADILNLAGWGRGPGLRPWTKDVLRHTAISHAFRSSGSYGLTAERFGNSEGVIKRNYQGRVTSEETKGFYAILPARTDK